MRIILNVTSAQDKCNKKHMMQQKYFFLIYLFTAGQGPTLAASAFLGKKEMDPG